MKLPAVFFLALLVYGVFGGKIWIPEENDKRIVGGQNAEREQFPFMTLFYWCIFPDFCQPLCGASVVTHNRVLTAAHCITETPDMGAFRVRAGILLQTDPETIGQTIDVESVIIHPDYEGGLNPNDIAVLNLATSFTFNSAVQPVDLPAYQAIPTGTATLTGWGIIETYPFFPDQLQYIGEKQILTLDQCAEDLIFLFGDSGALADTNVCTGGPGQSVCSGDSGGPLVQGNTQIGIVSWGVSPCGFDRAPSVYTRISAFVPWINNLL